MGIENLLRYKLRELPETKEYGERYGFYCPTKNKIWVSASPVALVQLREGVWNHSVSGDWFKDTFTAKFWEPFPYVEIDDSLLWE